ncbi:TNF receptor-associated factor homolog 1a-like [Medicago truncatula]|uniref:TNF receptor-associated factor homolog 1a-like n=1 Tax=Medicago truncatula TaxID=3880 RepID=UPI001967866A|nr:TNF receptor-associated factor homolog 1a-like [Medicago truncatula]
MDFCAFMKKSDQKDQMFWEEEDVIKEALVEHFFVVGVVTSPLLMDILYNGCKSIDANNATAKFVRIKENRFELVGDVPSLFNSVVGIEYKPVTVITFTEEDYERNVTKLGCMIVEIFVLDYLFRNKIEVNFTRSETEKKSKKKGKKKDKCVEENKQNDELIAADLEMDSVRALLNYLFMSALKKHEFIATSLKEKTDEFVVKHQALYVKCALKKAVTELYVESTRNVCSSRIIFRNEIRDLLKSHDIVEDYNDASKLYIKELLTLKPISGCNVSSVIKLGEYKWTFIAHWFRTSFRFELFADRDNIPRLKFYALSTVAIIHPRNYRLTDCSDRFHSVCKTRPRYVFHLERAYEKGFLHAEGNVQVELQIQMFGENFFPPLLVKKYRTELFLTRMHIVHKIFSRFIENTKENLKSLIQDNDKWSRFCAFMKKSDQKDQMFWEEDVIKEALVEHFFLDGVVTSPLLMDIYNGCKSIDANNATAKFVRIKENRFELVGDVPSLFNSVVGIEYKPIMVITPTEEDYENYVTKLGCMIVEIFVLDYVFRNKIKVNFTKSELEKKSNKKGKKKVSPAN